VRLTPRPDDRIIAAGTGTGGWPPRAERASTNNNPFVLETAVKLRSPRRLLRRTSSSVRRTTGPARCRCHEAACTPQLTRITFVFVEAYCLQRAGGTLLLGRSDWLVSRTMSKAFALPVFLSATPAADPGGYRRASKWRNICCSTLRAGPSGSTSLRMPPREAAMVDDISLPNARLMLSNWKLGYQCNDS
jgi:hypothetical protein